MSQRRYDPTGRERGGGTATRAQTRGGGATIGLGSVLGKGRFDKRTSCRIVRLYQVCSCAISLATGRGYSFAVDLIDTVSEA